ncbi:MAG: efflux RND transporter periplasmic adaptor subunit [Burkholderiales bacterium]
MTTHRWRFVILPLVLLAGLAAFAYYAFRAPAPAARGPAGPAASAKGAVGPVAVEVARVALAVVQEDIDAVGTLRSNEAVVVRPEISGRIERLNFTEGAAVRKGQVIVALDDSVPAAELAQAKANLALAESNFQRTQELEKQKFVSATAKDQALNGLRVAQASVQLAEARLARTQIVAPFGGVIGIRQVSVGDYVKEGQDLVTLEDISALKVDFRVPEQLLAALRPGQKVEVTTDALPGRTHVATVDAIDPLVDQAGRAVLLRARLRNNDGQLRPGMFVRTRLIVSQRQDALTVPEEALVPVGADQFVFRVVDGRAQRVRIRTGVRRGGTVEVVEGLAGGDVVVTAGQLKLRDGVPVAVGTPAGKPPAPPVAGQGGPPAGAGPGKSGG